jgi:transposase
MRGHEKRQNALFSYVSLEERVPRDHPLRKLRVLVNGILSSMTHLFEERYSHTGRPSIPPEQLLRALLLQILFTVRSERQLMEQLDYNLLYRWFIGLGVDDPVWDRTVFSINRDRLLGSDLAREFFNRVLYLAEWRGFVSDEHFSVDGTLIEAWASHKSFVRKDGDGPEPPPGRNPEIDFKGEKRSNATHESTTDPEARLYKKGEFTEAKLRFMAHALAENRNGLVVDVETTQANGRAEWEAAGTMVSRSVKAGATVGADKGYDTQDFVTDCARPGISGWPNWRDKRCLPLPLTT